jgi:asparagine synthase (glutamine-hydrolysing)
MCGIAGIIAFSPTVRIEKVMLERMADAIRHRGPDGDGFYLDQGVGLVHRRLSIVDLDRGSQPMSNEDGTIWISYNGEVYNHEEHRPRLEQAGHRFKSRSDTEIILHLYEEHGDACVQYLNGMFAFAIWDAPRRRLLLARDRMGIKPLYYARVKDVLIFGSEAKALFASGLLKPELDPCSIDNFFAFTYPLQPRSMFSGVQQVLPAQEVVAENGTVTAKRYWTLGFETPRRPRPVAEYAEELRAILELSVKRQLMSDVPLGAYLSGGIDSNFVVALMKKLGYPDLHTFSIGFDDPTRDETAIFEKSAREFGIVNHRMQVDSSVAEAYPEVLWHLEMPFRHPISVPYYHLSRFVRDHGVKVVLTGEGSDELFGGYEAYVADKLRRWVSLLPGNPLRRAAYTALFRKLGRPLDGMDHLCKTHFTSPAYLTNRYGCVPPWYYHWRMLDPYRPDIYSPAMRDALRGVDPEAELVGMDKSPMEGLSPLNASLWLESQMRLPNWILVIDDRCSMAHGVEARVPFLDHEVVEFVARLPVDLKLKGFTEKYILREAGKGLVPDHVIRRRKAAFNTPVGAWFLGDQRPSFVDDVLSEASIREIGIFDPAGVTRARGMLASAAHKSFEQMRLEYLVFGILGVQLLASRFGARAAHG